MQVAWAGTARAARRRPPGQRDTATMALVNPHGGGNLRPLLLQGDALAGGAPAPGRCRVDDVTSRETGDLIMLGIGGFTPLDGFMGHDDWEGVCADMTPRRRPFWPIPITLSLSARRSPTSIARGEEVALSDAETARSWDLLEVTEKYGIDRDSSAREVFRTDDPAHPGVKMVLEQGAVNLGGPVQGAERGRLPGASTGALPAPGRDARALRAQGWSTVAALQTRNPMHRSHEYLAKVAVEVCDGVLIHQLLGKLKPGDIPADVRTRAIAALVEHYFVPRHRRAGGLSDRHALRRAARGAAARAVPPELRLHAHDRRARPRRRGRLLRPVRRAAHLRPDARGQPRDPAAEDRLDLLVLQLRRHGHRAHLPARRTRTAC